MSTAENTREGKSMAGRPRQAPINPYIAELIREKGYRSIWHASEDLKLPYTTLIGYAESAGSNKYLEAAKRTADAFGLTLDEFVEGLLSQKDSDNSKAS